MNLSSNSQLLQKLQNIYSENKNISEHLVSPKQPRPVVSGQLNQIIDKSSPISYIQVKQQDIEQSTENLMKASEKGQYSILNQNENGQDIHLQKYSQISTISQQTFPILEQIEKKVKLLKYAKENDNNTCAAIIAKIKLFCLDNASTCCYDFYRSTDLILLKYMIFLLIQELNQRSTVVEKQEINNDQKSLSIVQDVVNIVYEMIEQMRLKQFTGSHIDMLDKQLVKIQNQFKSDQNNIQKKQLINKSYHQRISSYNFENCTTPTSNGKSKQLNNNGSQKLIKLQIEEFEQKKQLINKLNQKIFQLQNTNQSQQVQIQDLNGQIVSINQKLNQKQEQIQQMSKSLEILNQNNLIHEEEKEQYNTLFHEYDDENVQLKSNLQELQNKYQLCQQQYQNQKQEILEYYQSKYNQIQQVMEKENNHLKYELNENQVIIDHLLNDALYFANQYKNLVYKINNMKSESILVELNQLQQNLIQSEGILNSKLNAIYNFSENLLFDAGQEYLSQSQTQNQIRNHQQLNDQIIGKQNECEIMDMLLIQSQILEKFLI